MHGTASQSYILKVNHSVSLVYIIAKNPDIKKKERKNERKTLQMTTTITLNQKTFTLHMTELSIHQVSRQVCQTLKWWEKVGLK